MKPALFCTDNGKGLFTDNEKGLNEFQTKRQKFEKLITEAT